MKLKFKVLVAAVSMGIFGSPSIATAQEVPQVLCIETWNCVGLPGSMYCYPVQECFW